MRGMAPFSLKQYPQPRPEISDLTISVRRLHLNPRHGMRAAFLM